MGRKLPQMQLQTFSHSDRIQFTRAIIEMLDEWGVRDSDQVKLLGLPAGTRSRVIRSFRKDTPLPENTAVSEHVEHLLGIADALQTSNPCNSAAGAMWMNRPNYRFDDRTPLNAMLEDGLTGMMAVRVHLDCAYDWHNDATA